MKPKDYHSVVRVWAFNGAICAEVYCQTGDEIQAVLKKIRDCMNGKRPKVISFDDSVVRGTAISFARIYGKADYPPYNRPEEPGKTNEQ